MVTGKAKYAQDLIIQLPNKHRILMNLGSLREIQKYSF